MLQSAIVAVAFMLAAGWVAWGVVLPRGVRNHIRACVGASTSQGDRSASGGGCCGGCASDKTPDAGR